MIYKFDNIEVDTLNYRLSANGQLVSIEPLVFDLLVYLLTNRDRLVTRQEILDSIWEDREVSDSAISNLIKSARKVIGDDGNQQRIIKTIHGRGYQFILNVNMIDNANNANANLTQTYSTKVKLPVIITVLIIVSFLLYIFFSGSSIDDEKNSALPDTENAQKSIAVMAFGDMSPNNDQEYFSDGISEGILNVLAKIPNLHVISKSSAFAFKGKTINIPETAKKLGVQYILEGSVRKAGHRIRITSQLIEASSDKHLWSETYDRELTVDNIFDIQDDISAAIVATLKSKLGIHAQTVRREMSDINIDAYNEYLQGRFFVEKRTQEDIDIALSHFNRAIELAPEYALAWMGKAWANQFSSEKYYGNIPHELAIERAMPAIEKAMQLGPELAEVNERMGYLLLTNSEREKGLSYLEKVIQINPGYSAVKQQLALIKTDNPVEKLEIYKQAQQLNPMSMKDNNNYAYYLTRFGQVDEAEKIVKHMLAINASQYTPYNKLSDIRIVQDRQAEAALLSAKAVELTAGLIWSKYVAAALHADIGLQKQAAELMDRTPFGMIQHRFVGNIELYVRQAREKFPRNDNDSFGKVARATAELYAENYIEAAKYFKESQMCRLCTQTIYAFFQAGEIETAQRLLDEVKESLTKQIKAGIQYRQAMPYIVPIEIRSMEVAFLEGDIDRAIMHLKSAMKEKYIISFEHKYNPAYAKIRAHKDWPSILAESDRLAAEQRKIYQKLVLDGTDITL
ncbi:MAG: hypothetical protein GY781_12025 [Gammaproteobacteria bacterium]|nr:hypothetical protein [Gammaproteobacteria bacterium]